MRRPIRTALFAAADADVRRELPFLLAAAGIALAETASDGRSAWEKTLCCRPDLLIADAHLPLLDGTALAERVFTDEGCCVRPRVLLLHRREFPVPGRAKLEAMGAAFLAWPVPAADFCSAVRTLENAEPVFSRLRSKRADELLDALGVPVHIGREALRWSVLLCAEDERLLHGRGERLYPMVGEKLGLSSQAVERALRHVIGAAWRSDQFENQHRIFADTVDAGRGQPTCGEMIARLADILRLEG